MSFTDDDLKRLKAMVLNAEAFYGIQPPLSLSALLDRLEAAERVCAYAERWLVIVNPNTDIGIPLREWRKAVGK